MTDKILKKQQVSVKQRRCLSCGTRHIKPGRRYCSKECRQQINWVLALSKGLLKTFNTRYAAFYFTSDQIVLDMLPVWSKVISRFVCNRAPGNKPAVDLKRLILQSGSEWYRLVSNNTSKSHASLSLLEKCYSRYIDPDSIRPSTNSLPRFSKDERSCLKILRLDKKDLSSGRSISKIKSAYKRMAKIYHPDKGGDAEKFKQLNEAHQQMLLWTENPHFISRKALRDCWSYDGSTNRWSPPL